MLLTVSPLLIAICIHLQSVIVSALFTPLPQTNPPSARALNVLSLHESSLLLYGSQPFSPGFYSYDLQTNEWTTITTTPPIPYIK